MKNVFKCSIVLAICFAMISAAFAEPPSEPTIGDPGLIITSGFVTAPDLDGQVYVKLDSGTRVRVANGVGALRSGKFQIGDRVTIGCVMPPEVSGQSFGTDFIWFMR